MTAPMRSPALARRRGTPPPRTGHWWTRTSAGTPPGRRTWPPRRSGPCLPWPAGGMPYVTALPLDAVGDMAGRLVAQRGAVALQYGPAQGDPALREGICEVMSLEGIRAHPDEVVVTVGSQQALDLITRIFVDPGDVVLAEAPSYVGALGTFASYQAR